MRRILDFGQDVSFLSFAASGGKEEGRGTHGKKFDYIDETGRFGKKTWELAEAEMARVTLNLALKKGNLKTDELDALLAGDLENQCVASSSGLYSFGVPYIGLYSACSTATEALLVLSTLLSSGNIERGACVTGSHNSAAERQFRTPVEYGGQRSPTAQWTATAAGAFVIGHGGGVRIREGIIGKIIDGLTKDTSNMGAAMARAAFDTIYTYFSLSSLNPEDFDAIVTGDLGFYGADILRELLSREVSNAAGKLIDCGEIIYDREFQDCHAGGSGCGVSASMLAAHFLPEIEKGSLKRILFLSTGALMSPMSVLQGENILGIAPALRIERCDFV